MLSSHLAALARKLQQTVLVDGSFQAVGQLKVLDGFQAPQMHQYMLRPGRAGRLTQPCQAAVLCAFASYQQTVKRAAVMLF